MRQREKRENGDGHGPTAKAALRFAVMSGVAVLAIIAIGEAFRNKPADQRMPMPATPIANPQAADLARCRNITAEQLAVDDTCRRVWAENRRRFFASTKPVARGSDTPSKTQDRHPMSLAPSQSDGVR